METIKIGLYYIEVGKKRILDKEEMMRELEYKIADLVRSGKYSEA